jgi:para-aminobenzoate synthetase component 1
MAYYILKSYNFNCDPIFILEKIKDKNHPFLLDSSFYDKKFGRFSFLGFEPFFILRTKDREPFFDLRNLLDRYQLSLKKNSLPFLGGAIGFLSYDLGFVLEEKLTKRIPDDLEIPDCFFGFYSFGIIIDHFLKRLYIFSLGFPEKRYSLAKSLAEENFKKIKDIIKSLDFKRKGSKSKKKNREIVLTSNFTKGEYIEAIKRAKDYIRRGDIYQVNLSQRFEVLSRKDAFEVYLRLRQLSPSFYSGYFDAGDFQILSSSPEEFLRVTDNLIITRPMKGTRPRAKDKKKDIFLKNELLKSSKDKAELIMIVDLERNDLGKVCRYGSVKVKSLRVLEKYSTVFQTTSTVIGILNKDKDRIDLLRACFPGGSITGCPKIRAMQIIEELETRRRAIYTGALGYLSFSGNMHLNILIRSILKKGNRFYFGVGGGIVADSSPEEEYNETLIKAKAMLDALR